MIHTRSPSFSRLRRWRVNSGPQEREPSSRRKGESTPGDHDAVTQEELDSVLEAFRRLVQAAADSGRDWKLVDALLRTMIEFVLQTEGDLFISTKTPAPETSTTSNVTAPPVDSPAEPRLRLRPEYRLRLEAVIDSWSDDETADFLMIGARQVRRRAQQGTLYYFVVNRKRRYPAWQFDRFCGVLKGVAELGRALPESWSAEHVYAFMTTRSPALELVTPAQWLLLKRDPNSIVAAIADACKT
ncbi:hypothetical protein FIV50_08530 [Microbacterium foliorum]|uniref:Uncharacterized protein n=1 Tax=Microbacterium foliorum TaxID=104336 RepID=A0A4Y5YQR2_9MICO|nr:hypothetical protein [Microbacterium foliorum]QDE34833.1 hypothetical protein FIV50_08530 [Microbacterium foliorum]